ncbi:Mechanosensitive ion channel-domain-containing protein [Lentinula aciculospora]|uniref:Mechanosensitive ion channel-domain-containing protein n=1 Tax=Lentinula aciculospora TaxID=153920 RepID=A0A9W9AIP4_9AGAR|nr:Mechanosensitive ion channel-domain-containing protein [Lentinula aciculospora]
MYPPRRPASSSTQQASGAGGFRNPDGSQDPERAIPGMPQPNLQHRGSSSWDLLNGIRKFEHSYEEFDSRNASESHLVYAEGDLPKNKLAKIYNYLLNVSIVTRWFLFIVPPLALLWIPGILGLTTFPDATVWGVKLMWWSIWLSVMWGGWWVSLAGARILPSIIRSTLGVVAVGTRKYIDWASALNRYVALFGWTLAMWITWNPVVDTSQESTASDNSKSIISLIAKLLFGFFLCSAVLLFEKFSIQWIAGKFHEKTYAERIADQKFAVRSLVTLYRNSSDIPGRSDTLKASHMKNSSVNPKKLFKRAIKGVRIAATTTTTALGNVASEIAGSSVLQPNSPQAVVKTALESANKSRLLARRIFYSFARPGSEFLFTEDILKFFPNPDEADSVFALFDRDGNGDASREEIEIACMDFHREQLSIEHSMQDLDSAVGRLDNIFMSLYVVIAVLIIAVVLDAQFSTLITSVGTLVLGLSWLIGGSLTEVLTSIIFLFIKHPFDVGDRIVVDKVDYTVKEISLLSTTFLDGNGGLVQAPNSVLNDAFIENIRRSPQMSETFTFSVAYETTFEDLERLRAKMLEFVQSERRDYLPIFDVAVIDFPEQTSMSLSADIKYKSNSQQGAVKAKRRNKWICSLKQTLADVGIFGPAGNPNATPKPKRYTEIPWEEVKHADQGKASRPLSMPAPAGGWRLSENNPSLRDDSDNIFDNDADELSMPEPKRSPSDSDYTPLGSTRMPHAAPMPSQTQLAYAPEAIELSERR